MITNYAPDDEQMYYLETDNGVAGGRQDCPSERRRNTTTVLTAVWTGRPHGLPCVASYTYTQKLNKIPGNGARQTSTITRQLTGRDNAV